MMKTDRILLLPWRDSDAEVLYKWASDPDVGPRAGWAPHQSVEESLEIIRTVFNDALHTWAIELEETGQPIGAMGYGPSCECDFVDNPASGRVMEKCGFVPTGETCIDANQYQGGGRPIRVLRLELR